MGNYATDYTDIQPRLGNRLLTAAATVPASSVTREMVAAWILEAEAILDRHLLAIDLTVPIPDATGKLILRSIVVSQVTMRVIRAWELGTRLTDGGVVSIEEDTEWKDFLALISSEPGRVATMMGQGFGTGIQAGQLRSYITDNPDSKTIDAGDFDPKFTRDVKW